MFRRRRRDEDFAAEIRAHLEHEADRVHDEGRPEAAARRAFGNVAQRRSDSTRAAASCGASTSGAIRAMPWERYGARRPSRSPRSSAWHWGSAPIPRS